MIWRCLSFPLPYPPVRELKQATFLSHRRNRKKGLGMPGQWSLPEFEPVVSTSEKILNNIDVKVKNDHRSKFSNLSNWEEEA